MEFSGSWSQVLRNSLIDFYSCVHKGTVKFLDSVLETSLQETLKDRAEDLCQSSFISVRDTEHVEVTGKSQCDGATTTSWGRSCCYQCSIFNIFPLPFISIIETLHVNEKSKQFNRRLSTVSFSSWHVDIINEDSDFLSRLSTKQCTLLLFKLVFNCLLSTH